MRYLLLILVSSCAQSPFNPSYNPCTWSDTHTIYDAASRGCIRKAVYESK